MYGPSRHKAHAPTEAAGGGGGDVARRSVHARLPAFCWLAVRVRRRAWVIDQGATRAPARDAHDAQV